MTSAHDIVIVGGGSAGLVAARFAARLGARVALVEKGRIGGDCTWTGCVPSKALLRAARAARAVRGAERFGVTAAAPVVDFGRVHSFVRDAIDTVYSEERPERLEEEGIEVVAAPARFLDPHTLEAGERTLTARRFLLCTGARPVPPPIEGLEAIPFLTHEDIFENDRLPTHLLVLGAGPIGLELAHAYRGLGAEVTVVALAVMPGEDPEIVEHAQQALERDGVQILLTDVLSAWGDGGDFTLMTASGPVTGDLLVVATGRDPSVEGLGLEKAGVTLDAGGIGVDKYLRTSRSHIFAAGDVIGGAQFTHLASWQGFQAVRNALLPGRTSGVPSVVPRVTYLDPEIASVGATEAEARSRYGDEVRIRRWEMSASHRAVCDSETEGFIKVVALRNGSIQGASIVAARAGEMIMEFVLAMEHGLGLSELASTVHPYPTWSTPVQQLASEEALERFLGTATGRIAKRLAGR